MIEALYFKQSDVVKVSNAKTLIVLCLKFKSLKSAFFIIATLSSDENKQFLYDRVKQL